MESEALQIPKIDFSGLVLETTDGWDAVQGEVMRALESYGCFEALYNSVTPELRQALFTGAMPELFSLPANIKKANRNSDLPYQGYIGFGTEFTYESLRVDDDDVEGFTRLMWPQGNPRFRDTISTYIKYLKDLEQMIGRMVFRSLGIDEYYESLKESSVYGLRLAEYGVPLDQETKICMKPHFDPNLVSIICQNLVEGLEIQTKEGEWIQVLPSPSSSSSSFTVMIGEAFEALSNGRVQATLHRVRIIRNEKRYSSFFSSRPNDCSIVETPKELVDEDHPILYKPYAYRDHLLFRFSGGGARDQKTFKEFCGARGE